MQADRLRRGMLKAGGMGLLAAGAVAAARPAAAQTASPSLLRTVLDRGKVLIGTGNTNAPWHFRDDTGNLAGIDIEMGRILARGLFDDPAKAEFVVEDAAQRIPNIVSGKVDIVIQFMTVMPQRAQLVAFSRPYFIEQMALLTATGGTRKTFADLLQGGGSVQVSILQNAGADTLIQGVLPQARALQLDTVANAIQALGSGRVDAACVSFSAARWAIQQSAGKYADAGKYWYPQMYSAAMRQGDLDWLTYVNSAFDIAIHAQDNVYYDAALKKYAGFDAPPRTPGMPTF